MKELEKLIDDYGNAARLMGYAEAQNREMGTALSAHAVELAHDTARLARTMLIDELKTVTP